MIRSNSSHIFLVGQETTRSFVVSNIYGILVNSNVDEIECDIYGIIVNGDIEETECDIYDFLMCNEFYNQD